MGGGLESRCVGRVYSLDGAVTTHLQTGCRTPYAGTLTSNSPDDGRMRPKHFELRKLQ